MNKAFEHLAYRRQYVLSPEPVECPFLHSCYETGMGYHLYSHIDLKVTQMQSGERKIFLLGDMFDYRKPDSSNEEILAELVSFAFPELALRAGSMAGRYVILYVDPYGIRVFHDATATRKVYYCKQKDRLWLASQPHLLARILDIRVTDDDEKARFYASREFKRLHNAHIGDTTMYPELFQLMPNHYLDLQEAGAFRYWPNESIRHNTLKEAVPLIASMIRGYMESILNRYEAMIPVTAGKDSRTLLAATRSIKEKPYFYVNKDPGMPVSHRDIRVPAGLFASLDIDFHILEPETVVDPDFIRMYFKNNPYASESFLPRIYNYYQRYSKRVNLPGNLASSVYEIYNASHMRMNGRNLARLNQVSGYSYAVDLYQQWIDDLQMHCKLCRPDKLNLFYWEERLGNWGTQFQLEKDIAQEEFNPFNSRALISMYMSVPSRCIKPPFFILHKRVIRSLWPETLRVPINPGGRMMALKALKPLGIVDLYYFLKYSRLNGY